MTKVAIGLDLDEESAGKVWTMWDKLAAEVSDDASRTKNVPHMTVAIHDGQQPNELASAMNEIIVDWRPLEVRFTGFGVFQAGENYSLVLRPGLSGGLHKFHQDVTESLPEQSLQANYKPGAYTPHVTLARNIPIGGLMKALQIMEGTFAPFTATLDKVGLHTFDNVNPIGEIWQARLQSPGYSHVLAILPERGDACGVRARTDPAAKIA